VNSPGGRAVWGTQAWFDYRTVLAGDGPTYPATDKAHLITKPVFVMAGWLDGAQQFVPNLAHIEAWKRLGSTSKYLYLGTCGHKPDPCTSTNRTTYIRPKLHAFFDKHVRLDGVSEPCSGGGSCVLFQVPPPWVSATNNPTCNPDPVDSPCTTPSDWGLTQSASWPPPLISGSPPDGHKFYLHWNKSGCNAGAGCLDLDPPTGSETASQTFVNNPAYPHPNNSPYFPGTLNQENSPSTDYCSFTFAHADSNPALNEVQEYTSPVLNNPPLNLATPLRMVEATADLWLASDTTRLQVVADLYDVDGAGAEHRIAQTSSINVPTIRSGYTANNPVQVTFKPTGTAWTFASGH
jgi:hypothetical protein